LTAASPSREWTGRRVLVTGGAGFIGSHLVDALLERGASVVVLDDLSNGRPDNLSAARAAADRGPGELEIRTGDVTDRAAIADACRGVDVVYHQAAIASVPRSVAEPVRYLDANATGTLEVLLAARAAGVRRVVYAGSSSYYGDQPAFPRVESMAPDIRSPYAAAKAAGEFSARALAAGDDDFDAVTLRYFNIFGPRQRPDSAYAAVIPRFATAMLRGESVRLHGDGEQTRDFTYVGNAVHANLLAGEHPGRLAGAVFNVAAGQRRTVRELIDHLSQLCGVTPDIELAEPRPGEVRHSAASIEAATQTLGYQPIAAFEAGLAATVDWCREWVAAGAAGEAGTAGAMPGATTDGEANR
jgi:UDP-glucose 4-epimerase